ALRRVVAPERDLMNVLLRPEAAILDPSTRVYFQDIYDHVIRVADSIDTYRDLLSSALDSYLSVVSNRLNDIMKRLTAFSAILIVVALITGFFGMNLAFPGKDSAPELFW